VVQGNEVKNEDVLQQCELEDIEEPRRFGSCNCSDAQHHQGRRRRGNTNSTVPFGLRERIYSAW
jgi:hypothetical protein